MFLLLLIKTDAYDGGIRVLEPESVCFLDFFSLLAMLPVFMLYRKLVQMYKNLFFFYKEAFYGAYLFPHSGNGLNWFGQSRVFSFSLSDKRG